jgi:lipopolysaccharide/colanic/teichoic acid biosynthesis glycosyltransferase
MELNEAWVEPLDLKDARNPAAQPAAAVKGAQTWLSTRPGSLSPDAVAESEISQRLLRHYAWAGSFPGQAHMRLRLAYWCLLWQGRINGGKVLKRGFDFLVSLILLLALSPVFALIALLVKLEDGGPIFFAQTRVGRYAKPFKMFKIRSMCLDAEARWATLVSQNHHAEGITFKIKDDPRITRVGRWLRKFSLDELPQLYNVLIGDMSLVGPRPPLPREVQRYTLADHRRLAAHPGITCFWQVAGRSEIDFSGQVKLDVAYIEQQSFWIDLKVLLKTVPAVLAGKGAC